MPLPRRAPGLVISYAYLWRHEHRRGREEGAKARPCAIVLATATEADDVVVTVAPVTHSPARGSGPCRRPAREGEAPPGPRRCTVLDHGRRRFIWPGPDLRPISRAASGRFDYGFLPVDVFSALRRKIGTLYNARRLAVTRRSE